MDCFDIVSQIINYVAGLKEYFSFAGPYIMNTELSWTVLPLNY